MDKLQQSRTTRVGIVLVDNFALLAFASISEPMRVANLLSGEALFDVRLLPASGPSATSASEGVFSASARVGVDKDFDLVFVVATGDPFSVQNPKLTGWLKQLAHHGVILAGVSGGPVILASAGLMRGFRMTLHWEHAPTLAELHPDLVIERSIYVIDDKRLSCAGGTAGLDLMHALLTRQYGVDLAREVSEWLQHTEIRPAQETQRASVVKRYGVHHAPLVTALAAMETHLSDPLGMDDLVGISGVGIRQLNRLFRDQFDTSPARFYRELRLKQAQRLLQQSALTITGVAKATGFSNAAHFARCYRVWSGHSPREVRSHGDT